MLIGVEFQNRCPAVVRLAMSDFGALVDATLGGYLQPDAVGDEPPPKVDAKTARWAF